MALSKNDQSTRDALEYMLTHNERALCRAILAIYARQTASEQSTEQTHDHNNIGFTAFDAEIMSDFAKKIQKYGCLRGGQIPLAQKKMVKYWRQLRDIAADNGKAIPSIEQQQAKQ
jgi:hypothetical protein